MAGPFGRERPLWISRGSTNFGRILHISRSRISLLEATLRQRKDQAGEILVYDALEVPLAATKGGRVRQQLNVDDFVVGECIREPQLSTVCPNGGCNCFTVNLLRPTICNRFQQSAEIGLGVKGGAGPAYASREDPCEKAMAGRHSAR